MGCRNQKIFDQPLRAPHNGSLSGKRQRRRLIAHQNCKSDNRVRRNASVRNPCRPAASLLSEAQMPEQLTKHPEVTIQVLRSAGAKCGEGSVQEILTKCPADSFCKLPGGEICVYGLADASKMTQISTSELQALV